MEHENESMQHQDRINDIAFAYKAPHDGNLKNERWMFPFSLL